MNNPPKTGCILNEKNKNVCNVPLYAWQVSCQVGLAITYKMQLQQPTKSFCNFMQKGLAKNSLRPLIPSDHHSFLLLLTT